MICRDLHYTVGIAYVFEALAAVDVLIGRQERAATLVGAAAALFDTANVSLEPAERALHERTIETLSSDLGERELQRLWANGRTMSVNASIELALGA
jgi:hypothetical protein